MALNERIENIGERGASRRRRVGVVLSLLAGVMLIALLVAGAPPWIRLFVGIPAGLGAAEILQARAKT